MQGRVVLSVVVAAVFGLSVTAVAQEAYCTRGQYVWDHETRELNQRDNLIQMPIDSSRTPSGVCFVRMITTGTASRRAYTQTSRVLFLR
ncbi:hypothetical protein KAW64_09760 [bacterium]|nr:hypothetical protein [bacterium]